MIPVPGLTHSFTLQIELADPIEMGQGRAGTRRIIPITGGTALGPDITGKVLNLGGEVPVLVLGDLGEAPDVVAGESARVGDDANRLVALSEVLGRFDQEVVALPPVVVTEVDPPLSGGLAEADGRVERRERARKHRRQHRDRERARHRPSHGSRTGSPRSY